MFEHPYAGFLASVERPGRYVGGEYGAARCEDEGALRLGLAFPDAYEIGTSHMGLSVLYELANRLEGVCAERVFMPWPDMERLIAEHGLPLVTLESARPLSELDLLGFSLQYELTYTNVLAMLDLGRIPRRAAARLDPDPMVIAGGPLAVHCEPVAPFFDLVVAGDGEEVLAEICETVIRSKREGLGRSEIVARLAGLESVFAPGLLERSVDRATGRLVPVCDSPAARPAAVKSLGEHPAGMGPVPTVSSVFDRYSVEIARGCVEGCRFCQAGFLYRPSRERSPEQVAEAVRGSVECLGFDEVSLAALSSADHSRIGPIVKSLGEELTPRRVSLSVPSLRAYGLNEELVEVLSRLRATGVTLAPEAGSQRLRDFVNKNITEADLMAAAGRFFDRGVGRIKLYFMLGLPTETDEDLVEIVDLAARLRDFGRRRLRGRKPSVVVSVSTFVPKPFTPLEREEMIPIEEIERRQALLTGLCRARRLELRVHDPRLSRLEGILCRGDATLADAIERAVDLGARFDGWGEMFDEGAWSGALSGVDGESILRGVDDDAPLPWDHIDTGVTPAFRRLERDRAYRHETTRPCGRYRRGNGETPIFICHACGLKCAPGDLPVRAHRVEAEANDGAEMVRRNGRPSPRPTPDRDAGPGTRVRLELAVWGRQIFVGHLDRMRHLARSLRRAGLEVRYTQGFHPKPRIESAPPLPLGTAGTAELADIWLADPPGAKEMASALATAFPDDMEVVSLKVLDQGIPKLSRSLEAARYGVAVRASSDEVSEVVGRMMASEEIEAARKRKGRSSVVDVRPYLRVARVLDSLEPAWRLPEGNGRAVMEMILEVPGSGGTRPAEVLRPFADLEAWDPWIVRTGWILRTH